MRKFRVLLGFAVAVSLVTVVQYIIVNKGLAINTHCRLETHDMLQVQLETRGSEVLSKRSGLSPQDVLLLKRRKKKRIFIALGLHSSETLKAVPRDYRFMDFDGSPCPVNHCEITYDKKDVNSADFIYFDARKVPAVSLSVLNELRSRSSSQIWMWMIHENPVFTYYDVSLYNHLFNWSATYRTSSDIFVPYLRITELPVPESNEINKNYAEGKDKKVLVLMSHCVGYRIEFIKRLKKYIDVDVYGGCKNQVNPELPDCPKNSEQCANMIKRYKFYLAIENRYCEGYLTEKYYTNGLEWNLIPIVLSGGNFSNPGVVIKNSFINILDFSNMDSLGAYLNYLDKDDPAYSKYHQWRSRYTVGLRSDMCTYCKKIWEHDFSPQTKTLNLGKFWNEKEQCKPYTDNIFQKYLK